MELQPVKSSNIDAVGHEGDVLTVQFRNGVKYRYSGVPADTFENLMKADSIGKFVNSEIKPNFPYEKVEDEQEG